MSTDTQTPPPSSPGAAPISPVPGAEAKLREAARAQGTLGRATFDTLFGAGAHLWSSAEEFEEFQRFTREPRGKE